MTIKLSGGRVVPAITYDELWLDRKVFTQNRKTGVRSIEMNLAWSATVSGAKTFDADTPIDTVKIPDVDTAVVTKAIMDGVAVDLADAAAQIGAARTAAFTAYTNGTLTDLDLMVYYEMAIAMLAQMEGVGTVTGVE